MRIYTLNTQLEGELKFEKSLINKRFFDKNNLFEKNTNFTKIKKFKILTFYIFNYHKK